jgi:hypothetical protein
MDKEEKKGIAKEFIGQEPMTPQLVTILEGKAPEHKFPKNNTISGNIDSVYRFIQDRKEEEQYQNKKSFCEVSLDNGTMKLTVNEQNHDGSYSVNGKVELSKVFKELGINTTKRYEPLQLASLLRLKRAIFESHSAHAEIVSKLKNIKAEVIQNVEKSKQDNGDVKFLFQQEVQSNMPEAFNLILPLIKGGKKEKISVEVILEADGMNILCFLVSVDGQESIDSQLESLVEEQVKLIEKDVLVIYN